MSGVAIFTSKSFRSCSAVTVSSSVFDVTFSPLNVPFATASFATNPASISACFIMYVEFPVTFCPGSKTAISIWKVPVMLSVTVIGPVMFTFPVLLTL